MKIRFFMDQIKPTFNAFDFAGSSLFQENSIYPCKNFLNTLIYL